MKATSVLCAVSLALGAASQVCAGSGWVGVWGVVQAESAQILAERLIAEGVEAEGLEARIVGSGSGPEEAGDLTEALLLAGYDTFTVVRDVILAYGAGGESVDVAVQVAARANFVRGSSAQHLIDAGVLAAAAEIAQRQRTPVTSGGLGEESAQQARRDLERERLERMMRKGLLDDEYREYIEAQRRKAEEAVPAVVPSAYMDRDSAVYAILFTLGLVSGGYYDHVLKPGIDAGGAASAQ